VEIPLVIITAIGYVPEQSINFVTLYHVRFYGLFLLQGRLTISEILTLATIERAEMIFKIVYIGD